MIGKRPVGPASWLAESSKVREDLRKLRDHVKDVLDWLEQNTGGATNALLRSANDWAFPSKAVPVAGDRVLIEDSADGFAKKVVDVTAFSGGGGAPTGPAGGDLAGTYPNPSVAAITETSGPTQLTVGAIDDTEVLVRSGTTITSLPFPSGPAVNIYTDAPASPDPFNDEFDSGSPDLAVRGWMFHNASKNAPLTRIGPLDLTWPTVGMGGNQYRSSIIGSQLFIQFSDGDAGDIMFLHKAIAGGTQTPGFYTARIAIADNGNSSVNDEMSNYITLGNTSTGQPSGEIYAGMFLDSSTWRGRVLAGSDIQVNTNCHINPYDVLYANAVPATTQLCAGAVNSATGSRIQLQQLGVPGLNVRWGGVALRARFTAEPRMCFLAIDFIRRYPPNTWFGY